MCNHLVYLNVINVFIINIPCSLTIQNLDRVLDLISTGALALVFSI